MLEPKTVIQRNSEIVFSLLDDEYLALDAEAGFCYSLNSVSGHIWTLIEAPMTFDSLCAQLQQEYSVDEITCRRDVSDMLAKLAEAGLVQIHAPQTVA